jgi:ribulose-phosphate 3-epimerase
MNLRTHSRLTVAPSLLAANFLQIGHDLTQLSHAGAELLHLDIMDGQFVPPISFGDPLITAIQKNTDFYLEAHLMTRTPERHVPRMIANKIDRIIIHQEATEHPHRVLQEIRGHGCSSGIALNPGTSLSELEYLIENCDLILIMTVNPGWGGQKFLPSMLKKIEQAKELIVRRNLPVLLEVDGGINRNTIRETRAAGTDIFVIGSSLFDAPALAEEFSTLCSLINQ